MRLTSHVIVESNFFSLAYGPCSKKGKSRELCVETFDECAPDCKIGITLYKVAEFRPVKKFLIA